MEIRSSPTEILAITRLTVEEYGEGHTRQEASLTYDYRRSLEVREERLASEGREDLQMLRQLIRPKSDNL